MFGKRDAKGWKTIIFTRLLKHYTSMGYSQNKAFNLADSQSQNFGFHEVTNRSCGSLYNNSMANQFVTPGNDYYGVRAERYYPCNPAYALFSEEADWTVDKYTIPSSYSNLGTSSVSSSVNTGHEYQCPERHSSHMKTIDTSGNPNDNTKIVCTYFNDGYLKSQTPYIENQESENCKEGLVRIFGTALNKSHPINSETQYKNCMKDGREILYSWCQTKDQRNSTDTTRYPACENIYEKGKRKSSKQLPSKCQ